MTDCERHGGMCEGYGHNPTTADCPDPSAHESCPNPDCDGPKGHERADEDWHITYEWFYTGP